MKFFVLLITLVFATKENIESVAGMSKQSTVDNNAENPILVKIEEDQYAKVKKKTSKYIGVSYNENISKWYVRRRNKNEKKKVYNGHYNDEETAAHASDTLARKFMAGREHNYKLNFPDDHTEVNAKTRFTSNKSNYIGVSYIENITKWRAQRRSKTENTMICNGTYKDEETAAQASDTLARKLTANGEQGHKLNFPDDDAEVYPKKTQTSNYIGVYYNKKYLKWHAYRRSKNEKKIVCNGWYTTEETATRASDTLARQLIANGEDNHKLNFPDDETEVYSEYAKFLKNKRKRFNDLGVSQTDENFLEKFD